MVKNIGQRALALYPLQSHRQRPVLIKGQAQGLAGNGLLDLQFLHKLRDGRRADHLVFDPVAEVGLLNVKGNPAHDLVEAGLGQHVGDTIGHAEIGTDRAIEHVVEDAEHIGRRPADIHADDVDLLLAGNSLHDLAHRPGRRHNRRAGPVHQLAVARGLRHDVFEEEIVNDVPRRV